MEIPSSQIERSMNELFAYAKDIKLEAPDTDSYENFEIKEEDEVSDTDEFPMEIYEEETQNERYVKIKREEDQEVGNMSSKKKDKSSETLEKTPSKDKNDNIEGLELCQDSNHIWNAIESIPAQMEEQDLNCMKINEIMQDGKKQVASQQIRNNNMWISEMSVSNGEQIDKEGIEEQSKKDVDEVNSSDEQSFTVTRNEEDKSTGTAMSLDSSHNDREKPEVPKNGQDHPQKCHLCDQCQKEFSSESELASHLRTHSETTTLIVEQEKQNLKKNPDRFACRLCGHRFANKSNLNRHLRLHSRVKSFVCTNCKKSYIHRGIIASNLHQRHSETKERICSRCQKGFTEDGSKNSKKHVTDHKGKKENTELRNGGKRGRLAARENGTKRKHKCTHCDRHFANKSNLNRHVKLHSGEKPYECNFCDKKFARRSYLTYHLSIHSGEKPFICGICPMRFVNDAELKDHLKSHEEQGTCSPKNNLASASCRKNHLKIDKRFVCIHCQRSFANKSNLNRHVRMRHRDEKPYVCGFCLKEFAQRSYYNDHLLIHTDVKPYSCTYCEQSFTTSTNRNFHLRTHTGEKPYKCGHCSKRFIRQMYLKCHLRTHTGERPFGCQNCKQKFTNKSNLNRHVLRIHNVEEEQADKPAPN